MILFDKKCSIKYCLQNWKHYQKKIFLINGIIECKEQTDLLLSDMIIINSINNIYNFNNSDEIMNLSDSVNINYN